MGKKKETMYFSSNEALAKIFVLMLTIGISILASLIDYKSCYITILVQACNNIYDFYKFTDNKSYIPRVRNTSVMVLLASLIAIIVSIVALLGVYSIMMSVGMRVLVIFFVTLPLIFVYGDYYVNVKRENGVEI